MRPAAGDGRIFGPRHEVFITDWADAKFSHSAKGRFDLDSLHLLRDENVPFPRTRRPVSRACGASAVLPVFAATAILSETVSTRCRGRLGADVRRLWTPARTDGRTRFGLKHDLEWFEQQVIHTVPRRYPGRNRRVYPGLIQLGAFMSTQFTRHIDQHMDLFGAVMRMREEDAQKITEFYDEYLAVQDLSADFYLDTLHRVFQRRDLPRRGTRLAR